MTNKSAKIHMRLKDKEITETEEIRDIIRNAKFCHLGLIDGDEPYIVPVNIGYDEHCLYFHSALEGRKVDIIKTNNKVCFNILKDIEMGHKISANECAVKYKSVTGSGLAHIIEDEEGKIQGLKSIMRQNVGCEYDFALNKLKLTLVVKIDILEMKGKQGG